MRALGRCGCGADLVCGAHSVSHASPELPLTPNTRHTPACPDESGPPPAPGAAPPERAQGEVGPSKNYAANTELRKLDATLTARGRSAYGAQTPQQVNRWALTQCPLPVGGGQAPRLTGVLQRRLPRAFQAGRASGPPPRLAETSIL